MLIYYSSAIVLLSTVVPCFAEDPSWLLGDSLSTPCYSAGDCVAHNARCINSTCACLSTHINLNGSCLPKIKPGQSTCLYDEQCQAVWPNTKCVNTICQCRGGVHVKTRDGIVCVDYAKCPIGGSESILRDSNGTIADCYISPTGYMSGCLGQLHMYDCIKDKIQEKFFCCPNRANACHQPVNYGQEPEILPPFPDDELFLPRVKRDSSASPKYIPWYLRSRQLAKIPTPIVTTVSRRIPSDPSNTRMESERWYYDPSEHQCTAFIFKGEGGNANNFVTKEHCRNYCRTGCPRGNAMFQKDEDGLVEQYAQRQQMCIPDIGCGDPHYNCHIVQPGRALCCPTIKFVCSSFGGVPQREIDSPFDEGIPCGEEKKMSTLRYYFDEENKTCKPFSYRGCAGHFNNFMTLKQCQRFCGRSPSKNGAGTVSHRQPDKSPYNVIWPLKPGSTFG